MRFGPVALGEEAVGAILAHSQRLSRGVVRKGTRLGRDDVARLREAGLTEVVVARLEAGDMHEDAAAERLALAAAGPHVQCEPPFTGRANMIAEAGGVLVVDAAAIDAVNRIDPGITIATLENHRRIEAGRMVATVKIIPFAVAEAAVAAAETALRRAGAVVRVAPFASRRVAVVSTMLPTLKPKTVDKTIAVLGKRLEGTGAEIVADERVEHDAGSLADALRRVAERRPDIVLVFGASAIVDRRDVIPAAVEKAGGRIVHLGMPVDPGNLLLVGALGETPVLGAPGCARSPKENGFDWVLDRLLAGLEVTPADITGMGVGGLLMEIVSRPQPRRERPKEAAGPPRVAAVVLAAGRSTRMGGSNKLLEDVGGRPLVRRVAEAALATRAGPAVVVVGHQGEAVAAALEGLDCAVVVNPDYAEGLSTSLRTGLDALPEDVDGALILLGDMPAIGPAEIDRLIDAFAPEQGALVVVPTVNGRRGNPVLWAKRYFRDLKAITGDTGGRAILESCPDAIVEVEIGSAAGLDIDTPEALEAAREAEARNAPA